MNTVVFLDYLAKTPRYQSSITQLINKQSQKIKRAYTNNDFIFLKKQISDTDYWANPTQVIRE